jgi:glycosyltransferase involved in cell wall biosynthesis
MKRILATCFFPAFDPPASGGEQKLLRFYAALSAHFHIDLVTFTYPTRSETIRHTDSFHEHRVARPAAEWDRIATALQAAGHAGEFSGVVGALLGQGASPFRDTLARFWDAADIVMHDFPYTWLHDPFPADRSKLRVYNSHNLESLLTRTVFSGPDDRLHDLVEQAEATLCRSADLILATSEQEAEAMALVHAVPRERIAVLPVGFDPAAMAPAAAMPEATVPFALFIGSLHPPNLRAAAEVAALAQILPGMRFVIAGAVSAHLGALPPNVTATGPVDDDTRRRLFAQAAAFVSPMRDGAGMNVKLSEALGAGLPVVTTALGARGFEALAAHLHLAETAPEMAGALRALMARPQALRAAARQATRDAAAAVLGWPALAAHAARLIEGAGRRGPGDRLEPITLYLNDYPLGEGQSGGQRRMLELIGQTPAPGPRVLLTLTGEARITLRRHAPGFVEIGLPKTRAQLDFETATLAHNDMSIADVASAMHLADNPLFLRWFRRLARRAGTIVLEHCYMAPALDHLPPGATPRILYSAHNVEADLKAQMLRAFRHTHAGPVAALVTALEGRVARAAQRVIAVSQDDAARLQALYTLAERPEVIVNGTRIDPDPGSVPAPPASPPTPGGRLELIFVGSAHPPNVQGLRDIFALVWPHLSNARLTVVGSACEALSPAELPAGVHLAGRVSEARKAALLAAAHVAINPVTLGGGSSLKLGDYLAAGVPVASTATGARGMGLIDGETVLIAELGPAFVAALDRLRTDAGTWQRLAAAGRALAQADLDWRHLGQRMAGLLAPGAARSAARPSVLLVVSRAQGTSLPGLCVALDAGGAMVDMMTDADPGDDPLPPPGLRSLRRLPAADPEAALPLLERAARHCDHVLILGQGPLAVAAARHLAAAGLRFAAMMHGAPGGDMQALQAIASQAVALLVPAGGGDPGLPEGPGVRLPVAGAAALPVAAVSGGPAGRPVILACGGADPARAWGLAIAGFLQADLAGRADLVLEGPGEVPPLPAGVRHAGPVGAAELVGGAAVVLALAPQDDFGTDVLAGWMAGRPVIAGPGLRALVRDGADGFVVSDPPALADRLVQVLDDPALAVQMGQAGLARARHDFSPERVGAALLVALPARH